MNYERILVPLDGSKLAEQVLPYARQFAKGLRVPIQLLRVHDPSREGPQASMAEQYLSTAAESLQHAGVPTTWVLSHGDPARQIANEANNEPQTLVVMATHGKTGVGRLKLARVTEEALKDLTVPTLLVRSQLQRSYRPAVNLSDIVAPMIQSNLAEQVLPHVGQLAPALDATVVLMTVEQEAYETSLEGLVERHADAIGYLDDVGRELTKLGCRVKSGLAYGTPADAILNFVQRAAGYMLAVATIDPLPPQTIVGRVTRELVSFSDVPVLVTRAR